MVLPRPDLQPGPHRDLVDALHDLHHRAGWPSLRVLAGAAACSHTTVSAVFSSPRLPSWGVLELLVEAMEGDAPAFHRLWLAAGTPGQAGPTAPQIAGRVRELAVARRHLEEGTGLLVVAGEAGMGKTRLITSAASLAAPTTFVALGSCLPLSSDVPLLPVADLLRATYERDEGRWLTEAITDCPPYVAGSVQRLLPELETLVDVPPSPQDEWSRQRLFGAVKATLEALGTRHRLAVVLEDLHWADAATLDLVEHLVTRRVAVPLLATWRVDDPAVAEHALQWWSRARRLVSGATLTLQPLSLDETAEQLALLGEGGGPGLAERIHRRSRGQPLFTEQLAAQADGEPMPELLVDLLDRRLDGLGEAAWSLARALGVADRPLDDGPLAAITGLDTVGLSAGLHELRDRHLLRSPAGHQVELAHPLLAEAIRRRLVAPESVAEHHRIARALAASVDPSPAEVAEHWQRAEDPAEEIVWRMRAGRAAGERFALAQAAAEWRRVLDLWPQGVESTGSPPLRRGEAYLALLDALRDVDVEAAWDVAEEAMRNVADRTGPDSADIYQRAASIRFWLAEPERGLLLVERAIGLLEAAGPSVGYVRALHERGLLLDALGRYDEARVAGAAALAMCDRLDAPVLLRGLLIEQGSLAMCLGDLDGGLAHLDAAAGVELISPDPQGDIYLALTRTGMLTFAGRVGEEVVEAGRPGLEAAVEWGLESVPTFILRANMAAGLRLAGDVRGAAELVDAVPLGDSPSYEDAALHQERANLDLLRGRLDEAARRYDALRKIPIPILSNRIEDAQQAATVDLWSGRPRDALDRLVAVLRESMPTEASAETAEAFTLAMRAAADLAHLERGSQQESRTLLAMVEALLHAAKTNPFEASAQLPAGRALEASWSAERARLMDRPSTELWAEAARRWDGLHRPHDAAYCRWRGAQSALGIGHGTIALRLLRRAARDAREHVPLSEAIARTAARTTAQQPARHGAGG